MVPHSTQYTPMGMPSCQAMVEQRSRATPVPSSRRLASCPEFNGVGFPAGNVKPLGMPTVWWARYVGGGAIDAH